LGDDNNNTDDSQAWWYTRVFPVWEAEIGGS
jgi:hypothetical protein